MAPNFCTGVLARISPSRKSEYEYGNWSGIWLMDSMPPASTSFASPEPMRWQAFATASMPEAQLRCTVTAGTRSGTPARRATMRDEFAASLGIAQCPNTTSSIRAGSSSLRAITSAAAMRPSS
jgi:hypothetical protein